MKKTLPIETFRDLFINRDDIYCIQGSGGSAYYKISRPLNDRVIKDHMLGKQTIGLYQLKNNTVTWALIDIDVNKEIWSRKDFDLKDWENKIAKQAIQIKTILTTKGISSYREKSGFKGEHVWIFFNKPIPSSVAKHTLDSMFKSMPLVDKNIHIELFPKQAQTLDSESPGSLVKAPLGKHQRSGVFSEFIDDISGIINRVSEEKFKKAINEFDAIFSGCSALKDIRAEGIHSEHLGHEERLTLAYIFGNLGNAGLDYIETEVFSKLNDYDVKKTRYQLKRILDKGYKPITCKSLQDKSLCPGPCAAIGSNKSPIVFYYRQKGIKTESEDIKSISRLKDYEMHGHNYYDCGGGKSLPELLSNFILNLHEQVHVDDGIQEKTIFRGHVINEDGIHDIEIDALDFASNEKFTAALYSVLGNSGTYIANPAKVREASNKFSQKNKVKIKKIFGYNENHTKYYTPSLVVSADDIALNNELIISLEGEGQAEMLDMIKIDEKEFKDLKRHIKEDLLKLADMETTHTAFAQTLLPILEPFIDTGDRTRYVYFLRGQSGTGKSFLMQAMQNFYGFFPDDCVSWSSTPYAIQRLGYFFRDCMFLVDDFKIKNISNYNTALQIMQNYADMTARARLISSGTGLAPTYVIRGFFTSTGEDTVTGEASNLARMLVIEYKGKKRDMIRGNIVKKQKRKYRGFTPYYIKHVLNLDKEKISKKMENYMKEFFKIIEGEPNDIRIARNVSLLMTSYYYVANFMWSKKEEIDNNIIKIKIYLIKLMQDSLKDTKQEKASQRFWDYLHEFLASGKLRIVPEAGIVTDFERGAIIGFRSGGKTQLIHKVAFNEIQKILRQSGDSIDHSINAILHDLEADGIIESCKIESRKFNGSSVRTIEIELNKSNLIKNG